MVQETISLTKQMDDIKNQKIACIPRINSSYHFLLCRQYCASIRPLQLRIDKLLVVFQRIIGDDACIPVSGQESNNYTSENRIYQYVRIRSNK